MSKKKIILITLLIAIPSVVIALLSLSVLWLLLGIETRIAIQVLASLVLLLSILQEDCCPNGTTPYDGICLDGGCPCPTDGGPSDPCPTCPCPTDGYDPTQPDCDRWMC